VDHVSDIKGDNHGSHRAENKRIARKGSKILLEEIAGE